MFKRKKFMDDEDYTDVVWDGDKYLADSNLNFTRANGCQYWIYLILAFTALDDSDVPLNGVCFDDLSQEQIFAFEKLKEIGAMETGKRNGKNFYRLSENFLTALGAYNRANPEFQSIPSGPL